MYGKITGSFCIIFILAIQNLSAQYLDTLPKIVNLHSSEKDYRDFKIQKDILWALTKGNTIDAFSVNDGHLLYSLPSNDREILSWDIDNLGDIVIGDSSSIKQFDRKTRKWKDIAQWKCDAYSLVHDSKNKHYIVCIQGIYDIETNKLNAPIGILKDTRKTNEFEKQWTMGIVRFKRYYPSTTFLDSHDNFWVGFDNGEWGSGVNILNLTKKQFVNTQLTGRMSQGSPRSFAEMGDVIYFSSSLMHFDLSGGITKVENWERKPIFNVGVVVREIDSSTSLYKTTVDNEDEYLGPIAINPKDSCLYFYSQHGLFKGNPTRDLSALSNWEKVMVTHFKWANHGQSNAVGSPMNMLKMEFIRDGTLIFLTQNDGIGIWKNNQLLMTK